MRLSRNRWASPVAFVALIALALGCSASQADGNGSSKADASAVAKVGDRVITAAELDEKVRKDNMKAFQAYYDARKAALDQMITQQVIDEVLAERGITENELQNEIRADLQAATPEEIRAFFDQNQAQMGGRAFDQVAPQIASFLNQQRTTNAMRDFVDDLKSKAGVEVFLDPPRMEVKVAANDPKKGPEGAPITLVEFSDFQ